MGWFGNLFGQNSDQNDPLGRLDPKLRQFLEKESPIKYTKSSQQQQQKDEVTKTPAAPTPVAAVAKHESRPENGATVADADANAAKIPTESLYQDGRYAHLWKTYRPLAEVEAETKSDHEKLMDVLEAYKDRKSQIGRAALENCAMEQLDWNNCMKSGDWGSRLTMCRAEVKKFERCYMMQSRLLKALGYLSTYDRPASVDEQIQMHADSLYHRMLEQEAAIEEAKKAGTPLPTFAPLVPTPAAAEHATFANMTAEQKEAMKEQLDKLPEEERGAEEAAMKAELRAKTEMAAKVSSLWEERAQGRKERKEKGQATISDWVATLFSGK